MSVVQIVKEMQYSLALQRAYLGIHSVTWIEVLLRALARHFTGVQVPGKEGILN